jgi:hypothetical protein
MTDFRSRDQPMKPKIFSTVYFFPRFHMLKPFLAILSSSPSRNHIWTVLKNDFSKTTPYFNLKYKTKIDAYYTV